MTDAEALEIAVAKTRHRRFRELLDPAHPDYRPEFWPVVRRIAAGEPEPPPATAAFSQERADRLLALRLLVLGCDHRGPEVACGCNRRHACFLGKGEQAPGEVTFAECLACVS